MKSKIIQIKRTVGDYRYETCHNWGEEVCYDKPIQMEMPYCGNCKKVVLDANQNFCCWCGSEFEK